MLERWIVKHWIALSAGCLLMAAAVRMHSPDTASVVRHPLG